MAYLVRGAMQGLGSRPLRRVAPAPRPRMHGLGAVASRATWKRSAAILPPVTSVSAAGSATASPWTQSNWQGSTTGQGRRRNRQAGQQGQQGQGANWWQQQNTNTSGQPSTIQSYDPAGNPIYSVPPPGQSIVGYDQYGTPLYATSASAAQQNSALEIVGYDDNGNPIYATAATSYPGSGISTATAAPTAGSPTAAAPAATDTSGYQAILDWLGESTLISGFPNFGIVVVVGLGAIWLMNRGGRR